MRRLQPLASRRRGRCVCQWESAGIARFAAMIGVTKRVNPPSFFPLIG